MKLLCSGLFVFLFSLSGLATSEVSASFKVLPPVDQQYRFQSVSVHVEFSEVTLSETLEKIRELKADSKNTLLIAAENSTVLVESFKRSHELNLQQDLSYAFVLPIGTQWLKSQGLKVQNSLSQLLLASKKVVKNVPEVARKDTLGFVIATIQVGGETFRTVTSSELGTIEASANILLTTALATIFLDKDIWPKLVSPVKDKIRNWLRTSIEILDPRSFKELGITFAANFALMSSLQYGRVAVVNIEHLDRLLTLDSLVTPALIAATSTFSSFGFSEANALLDEAQYPKAKSYLRFFMNVRSIVIAWAAANVMLYHPDVYGASPWIVLGSFGITGIIVLKKIEPIRDWLEKLPALPILKNRHAPSPMSCKEAIAS